jgi:hypothetical protein
LDTSVRKINLAIDQVQPDSEQLALISERLQKNEQAPSARAQTDAYRFFQEQMDVLGRPYDVTRIPISICEQMQRDPMFAFGLHFIHLPVMRANWYIKCERADIAAFVDNAWRRIHAQYVQQRQQAMVYGFAPIVKRFELDQPNWTYEDEGETKKVWDNGNVNAIVWKPFVGLPSDPTQAEPAWDAKGQFNGIKWQGGNHPLPFPTTQPPDYQGQKKVDVQHALWVTNEKATASGSLWGYPRLGYGYRYWWSYWFKWALYDRFFERKADPPYVVYYPTNTGADYTEDDAGNQESMKSLALGIGESAKGGGTIAMPGGMVPSYDDRPTNTRQWEIFELEVKGDMTHFVESFEYLDVMKLRSLWIPEQALMEGKGGTSSRNVASEEIGIHKEGAAALTEEIDDEINKYIIPDLVRANYPDFTGEVKKVTTGFTEADRQSLDAALNLMGQNDPQALRHIDIRTVLDRLGMPVVSQEEINRQNEEAERALREAGPSEVDPNAEQAGVNEQGFYVNAIPEIVLSESDDFIATLPDSKHYQDSAIVSNTKALRQRWRRELAAIYEDFADFVNKEELSENFADSPSKLADKLIDKWSYSRSKLSTLLEDSLSLNKKVINRAARIELKKITDESWQPDDEDIADYLADRGAVYVRAVDETVKNELRTYLANAIASKTSKEEIVQGIREHFADFPSWKANRLARTEIRDAYNFATLAAGEQAGIKVVQIIDAQKGEEVSDPECIARNGKFFKIGEALSEILREHPNGTSEIRLTNRENLSIEYVTETPDDKLAYFDDQNGIIYLNNTIPQEIELNYLDQLGATLENEV